MTLLQSFSFNTFLITKLLAFWGLGHLVPQKVVLQRQSPVDQQIRYADTCVGDCGNETSSLSDASSEKSESVVLGESSTSQAPSLEPTLSPTLVPMSTPTADPASNDDQTNDANADGSQHTVESTEESSASQAEPTPSPIPTDLTKKVVVDQDNKDAKAADIETPSSSFEVLINEYRSDHSQSLLSSQDELCEAASQRAVEAANDFSHNGFEKVAAELRYGAMAENIWYGSDFSFETAVASWDESAGHKENMLGDWNYGCGGRSGNVAVFLFARD